MTKGGASLQVEQMKHSFIRPEATKEIPGRSVFHTCMCHVGVPVQTLPLHMMLLLDPLSGRFLLHGISMGDKQSGSHLLR